VASSLFDHGYRAQWYRRQTNKEDPWISIENHHKEDNQRYRTSYLYAEAANTHVSANAASAFGGLDVYIRNTPHAGTWFKVASQTYKDWHLWHGVIESGQNVNEDEPGQLSFCNLMGLNSGDFLADGTHYFHMIQELEDGRKHEFRWSQTSWLLDSKIQGYIEQEAPKCNSEVEKSCRMFKGLGRSSDKGVLLDGNGGDGCWYNSVGTMTPWHDDYFPGSCSTGNGDDARAKFVELYAWRPNKEMV